MKRFTTTLLGTALAAALFLGAPTNLSAKSTSTSSKSKKHKKKTSHGSSMTGHSTSTTKK